MKRMTVLLLPHHSRKLSRLGNPGITPPQTIIYCNTFSGLQPKTGFWVKRVRWVKLTYSSKAIGFTSLGVLSAVWCSVAGYRGKDSRADMNIKQIFGVCHRKSFTKDSDYWSYAKNELFKKINGRSFAFESDPSGTLLGGSHVFATARDWAQFGQLYLQVSQAKEQH